MGLFRKQEPCVFCGTTEKGLRYSLQGHSICAACYGEIDVEPGHEPDTITALSFYRAYREGNRVLASDFSVDYTFCAEGICETPVLDCTHQLLCFSEKLDRTIFTRGEITGILISEDDHVILRGTKTGVQIFESMVPQEMKRLLPIIERVKLENQNKTEILKLQNADKDIEESTEVPRPFEAFHVKVFFHHPYWDEKTLVIDAPRFDSAQPSSFEYMQQYKREYEKLWEFTETVRNTML